MRNLADDQREDGKEILSDGGEECCIHTAVGAQRSKIEAFPPTRRMFVSLDERIVSREVV